MKPASRPTIVTRSKATLSDSDQAWLASVQETTERDMTPSIKEEPPTTDEISTCRLFQYCCDTKAYIPETKLKN